MTAFNSCRQMGFACVVEYTYIDTQDVAEATSAAQTSLTNLLPQAEPVDCEACFLKTLHTSGQWTLWKSFVEFRCRIGVNFAILITSKEKFSRAGRYGAARADQRWLRAPAGFSGLRTKGFSWDAWTSGIAAPEAGFRFRANQSRRSSCWNLRGTNSSRSGRQRRTVAGSAD